MGSASEPNPQDTASGGYKEDATAIYGTRGRSNSCTISTKTNAFD
jgi:hypothetical protein